MERVHETGCDEQHGPRQRCNVPRTEDAASPVTAVAPRTYIAPKRRLYPPVAPARARVAVFVELMPGVCAVAALGYLAGLIALNINTGFEPPLAAAVLPFFAMVLLCCCGGTGWIMAGRRDRGCLMLALRALLVISTLWAGLFAFFSSSPCSGCPTSYTPLLFFGAVFSIGELVAVGSAIRLRADLTARRRPAPGQLDPNSPRP